MCMHVCKYDVMYEMRQVVVVGSRFGGDSATGSQGRLFHRSLLTNDDEGRVNLLDAWSQSIHQSFSLDSIYHHPPLGVVESYAPPV